MEYVAGLRQGSWVAYDYPHGRVAVTGQFRGGLKQGSWTWHPSWGRTITVAEAYDDGKNVSPRPSDCPAGSEVVGAPPPAGEFTQCELPDGTLHGPQRVWFPNGKLREESRYNRGRKDGLERAWFDDGSRFREANYVEGAKHGAETEWHKGGAKAREAKYLAGKMSGPFRAWDEDGHLLLTATYAGGVLHGRYTQWHPNGQKALEGTYTNGWAEGEFQAWSDTGKTTARGVFKQGQVVSGKDPGVAPLRPATPPPGFRVCAEYATGG